MTKQVAVVVVAVDAEVVGAPVASTVRLWIDHVVVAVAAASAGVNGKQ